MQAAPNTVVPFELSTAVGYAIRRALALDRGQLEIIGLANEYGSYTATAEEYRAQDYMGASTLWGPQQAAFVVELIRRLRRDQEGVTGRWADDDPGTKKRFGPQRISRKQERIFNGLERLIASHDASDRPPFFYWCEPEPPPLPAQSTRSVEVLAADGRVVDRLGLIIVIDGRPRNARARWAALWISHIAAADDGPHRFRVRTGDGRTVVSDLFDAPTSPPADCPKLED